MSGRKSSPGASGESWFYSNVTKPEIGKEVEIRRAAYKKTGENEPGWLVVEVKTPPREREKERTRGSC